LEFFEGYQPIDCPNADTKHLRCFVLGQSDRVSNLFYQDIFRSHGTPFSTLCSVLSWFPYRFTSASGIGSVDDGTDSQPEFLLSLQITSLVLFPVWDSSQFVQSGWLRSGAPPP
jgi:hypothetical protein